MEFLPKIFAQQTEQALQKRSVGMVWREEGICRISSAGLESGEYERLVAGSITHQKIPSLWAAVYCNGCTLLEMESLGSLLLPHQKDSISLVSSSLFFTT